LWWRRFHLGRWLCRRRPPRWARLPAPVSNNITKVVTHFHMRWQNIWTEAGGRHTSLKKLKGLSSHGLGTLNLRV
jgi:hypothetical protein